MTKMVKRRPLFLGKRPVWRIVQIGEDRYVLQSWIWLWYAAIGSSFSSKYLEREKRVVASLNKEEEQEFSTPNLKRKPSYASN